MKQIQTVSGPGIPVRGNDIDTDRIIPARYLRCVTFDGLGEHAFADDRSQLAEAGKQHPFDNPAYAGATILVVNKNFGCGSSREHAPQALAKWGITGIVGVSFAEIFHSNCLAMGIPCLTVEATHADALQRHLEEDPGRTLTIDVEQAQVGCHEHRIPGIIAPGAQQMLLSGQWDATGELIQDREAVAATMERLPYTNTFA